MHNPYDDNTNKNTYASILSSDEFLRS